MAAMARQLPVRRQHGRFVVRHGRRRDDALLQRDKGSDGHLAFTQLRFPLRALCMHAGRHDRRRPWLRQVQRHAQATGRRHARAHGWQGAATALAEALQDGLDDGGVVELFMADAAGADQRRHQQHRHAQAVLAKCRLIVFGRRRRHMVEKAAVFVIADDQQGALPCGTLRQRLVHLRHQRLAGADIGRRMVVVDKEMRIDPADSRQGAGQRIADKAVAAGAGAERLVALGRTVMIIGKRQRPGLPEGIEFPADTGMVELAHKRFVGVQQRRLVVPAAGRAAADGIQAVRPGGARHRTVAAVADAELAREKVIHRQVGAIVIAHHQARIGVIGMGLRVVADEAAIIVLQLARHRGPRMAGILAGRQCSALQMVDGIGHASVHVDVFAAQAVDLRAPAFQAQVAQHMVEGTVFHHQHDDMVDARQLAVCHVSSGRRQESALPDWTGGMTAGSG